MIPTQDADEPTKPEVESCWQTHWKDKILRTNGFIRLEVVKRALFELTELRRKYKGGVGKLKVSSDVAEKMAQLYDEGVTPRLIAERYGVSASTAVKYIKQVKGLDRLPNRSCV